jgi:hypothetical protein
MRRAVLAIGFEADRAEPRQQVGEEDRRVDRQRHDLGGRQRAADDGARAPPGAQQEPPDATHQRAAALHRPRRHLFVASRI